jgi:hypothetical protein
MGMTGGCLCSQVRYRVKAAPVYAGHCHCRDCQRASGAGHVTAAGFRKSDLELTGELKMFAMRGGSGKEARRFFCPTCGSMIYAESDAGPGGISLSAGTLDDPSQITPQFACFSRDRAPWDHIAPGIAQYETLPGTTPT